MFFSVTSDVFCFIPEIFFGLVSCLSLLVYSFFSIIKLNHINKTFVLQKFAYGMLLQLLFLTFLLFIHNPIPYIIGFFGCLVYDFSSYIVKSFLLFVMFVVFTIAEPSFKISRIFAFEFFILILFSCFSLVLIIQSNDFLCFYLALELQALCFYALASFKRNSAFSVEAGLKYFIIGAFSSGIFLFGCSIIYGVTGTTNFSIFSLLYSVEYFSFFFFNGALGLFFIILGFFFKLTVAPFHIWAVDVYEGSPTVISFFFAVVPKISFIVVLVRLVFYSFYSWILIWSNFFIFVSFCCIVFGAFGAMAQRKLKRFLVYSSVSHLGYIILAFSSGSFFGVSSIFFYLFIYIVMSFSVWSVFFYFFKKDNDGTQRFIKFIEDLRFLPKENPVVSFCLVFVLFSIAGIPPIAGFYAKMFIFFSTTAESSLFFMTLVVICISILGTFYYLRVVKILSFSIISERSLYKSNFFFFTSISKIQSFFFSFSIFFLSFFWYHPELSI